MQWVVVGQFALAEWLWRGRPRSVGLWSTSPLLFWQAGRPEVVPAGRRPTPPISAASSRKVTRYEKLALRTLTSADPTIGKLTEFPLADDEVSEGRSEAVGP